MQEYFIEAIPELIATLVGVTLGGFFAFAAERHRERGRRNQMAETVLRSISQELRTNYDVTTGVLPHFQATPFGKSFFLYTSVWDTVLATDELPDIIGYRLADIIAAHYGLLSKLRYYGDLLVQVWLAPDTIEGYAEIRAGFRKIIVESLSITIENHPRVMEQIERKLAQVSKR
jgi:hypothetical protein